LGADPFAVAGPSRILNGTRTWKAINSNDHGTLCAPGAIMREARHGKWMNLVAVTLWAVTGCSSGATTATKSDAADSAGADAGGDAATPDVPVAQDVSATDFLAIDATATDAPTGDVAATDAMPTDAANPADAAADAEPAKPGALVLNEVGAKGAPIGSWNPQASDWMELYNGTDAAIDLKGYVTVDKKSFDIAGQLPPGTKIAAKGYLIVWFNHSGIGTPVIDKGISSPGSASVFAPDGKLVDTTTWVAGAAPAGGSWARAKDGGLPWKTFTLATPEKPNSP